jgi:membrane-bound lytic murein transglycosylase D
MDTRKKIYGLGIASLLLFTAVFAGEQQQNFQMSPILPGDSTVMKDSVQPVLSPVNAIKNGFQSLFTPAPENGIYTEHLNPQALIFVQDYISKNGKNLQQMKTWGKPYFDMMDLILIQHGLPKELKYLAVIESRLKSNVRSWAGAVGPWQFMPVTARNFGLRVGKYYDERTDYFKSTHAASRYLTDLFATYGDWLLVIAAYNGGPANVNAAIRKSGSKDFWKLQNYLPAESKNHVKKFIATHYIMEGQGGVTTSTKEEISKFIFAVRPSLTQEETDSSKTMQVAGRYNSAILIIHLGMNLLEFNKYNPEFDKVIATEGTYELRLPVALMEMFVEKKSVILNESIVLLLDPVTKKAF